MMDRWLGWLDVAKTVPAGEQAELAARDLLIRKAIVERDPANVMGERLFGKELNRTPDLVPFGDLVGNHHEQGVGSNE